jgi:hypothetical protein
MLTVIRKPKIAVAQKTGATGKCGRSRRRESMEPQKICCQNSKPSLFQTYGTSWTKIIDGLDLITY